MPSTTVPTPFPMRLIGALAIDPITYEEVENDRSATWQALLVVVMSSAAAGIGARRSVHQRPGAGRVGDLGAGDLRDRHAPDARERHPRRRRPVDAHDRF